MFYNYLVYFFIFVLGLIVGSFLNCVIYRLALPNFSLKNLGGLKNRSHCPHCKHQLSWPDLIPVLSFFILKGKCRYCQKNISWQYPLVEIATGALFLLIFNFSAFAEASADKQFLSLFYYLIITCFLIVIFVYDLKHYIIPDKVIYPTIVIVFLYRLFENWKLEIGNWQSLLNPLFSAFLAASFFLLIVLLSKGKWLGVGDIKLAFLMGLFLGWPDILVALFLAFLIGAIIGIGLMVFGGKTLKSELPFAPFLITGTFLALFFGQEIINWYWHFF